jgi:hypothetical protein
MRRETPENQHNCSSCYGAGTRVQVQLSRYEPGNGQGNGKGKGGK